MAILQGDAYALPFTIKDKNGIYLTDELVDTIEFSIGTLTKYYPSSIGYESSKFYFPLSQEESLALTSALTPIQVRVKLTDGTVVGKDLPPININECITKKVI